MVRVSTRFSNKSKSYSFRYSLGQLPTTNTRASATGVSTVLLLNRTEIAPKFANFVLNNIFVWSLSDIYKRFRGRTSVWLPDHNNVAASTKFFEVPSIFRFSEFHRRCFQKYRSADYFVRYEPIYFVSTVIYSVLNTYRIHFVNEYLSIISRINRTRLIPKLDQPRSDTTQ